MIRLRRGLNSHRDDRTRPSSVACDLPWANRASSRNVFPSAETSSFPVQRSLPSGRPVTTRDRLHLHGFSNTSVKWSVPPGSAPRRRTCLGSPSKANWRICPLAVASVVSIAAATGSPSQPVRSTHAELTTSQASINAQIERLIARLRSSLDPGRDTRFRTDNVPLNNPIASTRPLAGKDPVSAQTLASNLAFDRSRAARIHRSFVSERMKGPRMARRNRSAFRTHERRCIRSAAAEAQAPGSGDPAAASGAGGAAPWRNSRHPRNAPPPAFSPVAKAIAPARSRGRARVWRLTP